MTPFQWAQIQLIIAAIEVDSFFEVVAMTSSECWNQWKHHKRISLHRIFMKFINNFQWCAQSVMDAVSFAFFVFAHQNTPEPHIWSNRFFFVFAVNCFPFFNLILTHCNFCRKREKKLFRKNAFELLCIIGMKIRSQQSSMVFVSAAAFDQKYVSNKSY